MSCNGFNRQSARVRRPTYALVAPAGDGRVERVVVSLGGWVIVGLGLDVAHLGERIRLGIARCNIAQGNCMILVSEK